MQQRRELWGREREDILSGNFDLLAMNNPPYSFEEATRRNLLAASGQPQLFDWQLKRGDGSKIWGEVNLRRTQIGGENFLLAVIREVTERKRQEELLREREWEFRTLVENAPDNIARYDRQCRIVYRNLQLEASQGIPELERLGKTPCDVYPNESFNHYEAAIKRVIASGETAECYVTLPDIGAGERYHHIRMVPERDECGEVDGVLAFGRDITDLKRLGNDLRRSEQQFRTLAENTPDPIFRYDRNCRRLYVNPAVEQLYGKPLAELIGGSPADGAMLVFDQSERLMEAIRCVFDSGETGHIDLNFINQEGQHRDYHMLLVPERDADGQVATVLALARDITVIRDSQRWMNQFLGNVPGFVFSFQISPEGHGCFPFASDGIKKLYGLRPEDVRDDMAPLHAMAHAEDAPRLEAAIAESARTMTPFQLEFRVQHPGWPERWIETRSVPVYETGGHILWHGLMIDITERKRLDALLIQREQEFRALSDNCPDVIVRYDCDCRRVYVNPKYQAATGLPAASLLGKTPLECWGPPTMPAAAFQNLLQGVLASGETAETELEWQRSDGTRACFSVTIVAERDTSGRIVSVLTISRDTTAIKQTQEMLHKREQEFRALAENSPDTIARYDRDCRRVYANPRLMALLGGDMTRILDITAAEYPASPATATYQEKIREVFERGEKGDFELRSQAGGIELCTQIRLTPEFDSAGEVAHVLAVGRDITEIDQYRQKIHHHAFFDGLTGLPNRQLLSDRLSQAIADAAYHGQQFGLMLLDLDRFKEINDTLGHDVGDRLLCEAAKRMQNCVRVYDTVARLGGDEFSVLLPDMRKGDDLATIAGKILLELAEPFVIDCQELFVTGSIGIARYPDDSTEVDALFKYADSAMYHAKKMGRNNFQFYATEMTTRSLDRMEIGAALRKARKNDELALHFQPQIELQTGQVTGAEALLRWYRPGHGMVMPDRFIPIAEESGLIVDIGEWVLRTACAAAVDWNRERKIPFKIAVNISTRQFIRNDLVGSVRRILAETGCKAEWLELEITESLLLDDSDEVAAMLVALYSMGMSLSIDDFGTGYSALSYLNRFPVSQLKIDRSFVKDIPEQRDKCELVKAMLSIAAALRLESVAEGVETSEQAEYLTTHGCRVAQGYLFGKPMPRTTFESWLASGHVFVAGYP